MTICRPVPGYEDLYATIDGDIISGLNGSTIRKTRRPDGYLVVRIPNVKQELVHRLVAAAFLGPCPLGMQVRHGDNTKHNNHIANLCYGTPRDNTQDAMRDGVHQGAVMSAKTECHKGHPFTPGNTYVNPSTGSRHCRTCRSEYMRHYLRRAKRKG